jgi:hypothetical protein
MPPSLPSRDGWYGEKCFRDLTRSTYAFILSSSARRGDGSVSDDVGLLSTR